MEATVSTESNRHYKWVVVGVIWLMACLNYTGRMSVFSAFPVLKRELGISDMTLAFIGSSFLWIYGGFSPVGGYLGDRFRRSVILASLVIFSVVTFATGLARSGPQLIVLRCLLGISEAAFLPPALAYIASFHSNRTRSLANSL